MDQEMTRGALVRCLEQIRKAVEVDDPHTVPPPSFIEDMTDRELCVWDVKLYELAIEALDTHAEFAELRVALAEVDMILGVVGADRDCRRMLLSAMRARTKVVEAERDAERRALVQLAEAAQKDRDREVARAEQAERERDEARAERDARPAIGLDGGG